MRNIYKIDYDIYITSDEETIKAGDWLIVNDEDVMQMKSSYDNDMSGEDIWVGDSLNGYATYKDNCKKIILTTDVDLIKDAVQAIDDEFLKWFVKNPSCKEVEVKEEDYSQKCRECGEPVKRGYSCNRGCFMKSGNFIPTDKNVKYKIIIPQEELKLINNCPKCGLDLVEREGSKPVCTRIDCGGIILSNETLREWALKEKPKQEYNNLNYGGGFTEEDIKRNSIKKQETLEEASERYAESKSSNFRNTHIRDFKAGAKSDAAKEYWYKKFWEDYNSQFKKQIDEQ